MRPFWFYIPVILAGLFPWTPLLLLLFRRVDRDIARRFLTAVVGFGFLFFSASTNKLPGYLLPLFPPLCALLGTALAEVKLKGCGRPAVLLTACAALLAFVPIAGTLLPRALAAGLSRASWDISWSGIIAGFALAAIVWFTVKRGRPTLATSVIAAAATIGVVYLKIAALPQVDREVSSRSLWREIKPVAESVCVSDIHRNWRYGLNYYSETPLPDCAAGSAKLQIVQQSGARPELRPR